MSSGKADARRSDARCPNARHSDAKRPDARCADGKPADGGRADETRRGPRGEARESRRTSSTARAITLSLWLRRLASYFVFDIALVIVLTCVFVYWCNMQMPAGTFDGMMPTAAVSTWHLGQAGDPPQLTYTVVLASGETYAFPVSSAAWFMVPVLAVTLVFQAIGLITGMLSTTLVRRKLKPLNDLALTAEAIGSAAADGYADARAHEGVGLDQIEQLEHAIEAASVDSPQVSTGDKDLRSIEVALNGLLRSMQEAKLQQMRFVSDASHELRTPIAVIQGYVNMLDRWGKTDPEVLDESIEALKSESTHMKQLVEQLLFLARGDSGRNTLDRSTFSLAEVVHEVWEESAMIDHDHAYVCGLADAELASPAFQMVGDLAMVKQSLRIVVQNAAKYSEAGTTITLGAQALPGEVTCTVQDEGIGMSASDIGHIFDRFWRADKARSGQVGGSGLGLSIAKWIVDAHDGKIDVLSHEGIGTRFTLRFPVTRQELATLE